MHYAGYVPALGALVEALDAERAVMAMKADGFRRWLIENQCGIKMHLLQLARQHCHCRVHNVFRNVIRHYNIIALQTRAPAALERQQN
jgi:hypothetical protein